MIRNKMSKYLMAMAIVSILAAAAPISAAAEVGEDPTNMNLVDEDPVAGDEIVTNATLNDTMNRTNTTDFANFTNDSLAVDANETDFIPLTDGERAAVEQLPVAVALGDFFCV